MAEEKGEAPLYDLYSIGILEDDFHVEPSYVTPSSLHITSEAGFGLAADFAEESTPVSLTIKASSLFSEVASGSQDDAKELLFAGITPTSAIYLDGGPQNLGFSEIELDADNEGVASEGLFDSVRTGSVGHSFDNSNVNEDPGFVSLDVEEDIAAALPEKADEKAKSSENGIDTTVEAPPWARAESSSGSSFRSPFLQLHQEIVDFCNFVAPTEEEKQLRAAAVDRVSAVVKSIWPSCQVKVFGSFATGLFLPTSDCDVVILESGCRIIQDGLKAIAKALNRKSLIKKLQIIGKARVPIIKFVEAESNISFDISFDVANGPGAASFIKEAMSALPPLKPLCLVLKIFLQQRELNEVYTGGIGSYALLVMLMTHLQMHPSRRVTNSRSDLCPLESNLGVLLVDFFDFYGRALNVKEVGISCRSGGRFYTKVSRGFSDSVRPYLLSVEDPQAPDNDIGKNSFNVTKVRSAFLLAHRVLTKLDVEGVPEHVGLLGRIVRVDEKLTRRKYTPQPRPERLESAARLRNRDNFGSSSTSANLRDSRNRMSRSRSWNRWEEFQDDDFPRSAELDRRPSLGQRSTETVDINDADADTQSRNHRYQHKRRSDPFSEEVRAPPHKKQRSMVNDSMRPALTRHDEQRGSKESGSTDKPFREGKMAKQKPLKIEHSDNGDRRRTPDFKKGKRQRIVHDEDPVEEGEIVFEGDLPASLADDGRSRELQSHGEASGHGKRTKWFDEPKPSKHFRLHNVDNGSVRSRKKVVTTKLGHKKIVYL